MRFKIDEIQRGMIGIGEFKLRNCFSNLVLNEESVTIQKCHHPQEIVNFVKGKQTDTSNLQHTQNLDNPVTDSDGDFEKDIQLLQDKSERNKHIEFSDNNEFIYCEGHKWEHNAVQLFPKEKCNLFQHSLVIVY